MSFLVVLIIGCIAAPDLWWLWLMFWILFD